MQTQEFKTDIIISLQERGYDHDFILDKEYIRCLQYDQLIPPDDFEILEVHYCKGEVREDTSSIIYAIQLNNYDIKGILMSKYNTLFRGLSIHLWGKLYSKIKLLNELNRPVGSKEIHPEFEMPGIHVEY